jgi:hypothetical protein
MNGPVVDNPIGPFTSPPLAGHGPRGLGELHLPRPLRLHAVWAQPNSGRHARQRRLQTPYVRPLQAIVTQQHPLRVPSAPAHPAGVVRWHRRQGGVDGKVDVGVVAGGAILQVLLEQRPVRSLQDLCPFAPSWCTL